MEAVRESELAQVHEENLRQRFGLPSFHPWQWEAVEAVLSGCGRALVIAPTGGGKSICYQYPATELQGTTLVVSPLIALMDDQVRSLKERGIPATYLASTLASDERYRREQALFQGAYKLVYVAPERLVNADLRARLAKLAPPFIAIDEAHCISQWGHDFRPDYLTLGDILRQISPGRVLACTATATPQVRQEIRARLGFDEDERAASAPTILRGFARPNLHLEAQEVSGPKETRSVLLRCLEDALGDPSSPSGGAIVYAATRKNVESYTDLLREQEWRAAGYHAGMDPEARTEVSHAFAAGRVDIVVATNAFGMGIDRSDIRLVVHVQAPGSIEAYYQEVGRAGRDGAPAHGILLSSPADFGLRKRLLMSDLAEGEAPSAWQAHQWRMFLDLMRYVDAGSCRHDFVLRYFGDEQEILGGCGHCDICVRAKTQPRTVKEEAIDSERVRKALAGVARVRGRAGLTTVADMLRGISSTKVRKFGLDSLTTFGLLEEYSSPQMLAFLRRLLTAGLIDMTNSAFPVPILTTRGLGVMKGEHAVCVQPPPPRALSLRTSAKGRAKSAKGQRIGALGSTPESSQMQEYDGVLFEALREARRSLAKERSVAAFVVCHDRTLREIAASCPQSEEELLAIHGMGASKVENYGQQLMQVVREHVGASG